LVKNIPPTSATNIAETTRTAGDNAQMTFQWIPGHCGIEENMRADSIAKDATTLPQTAEPVDLSTAKTVSVITVPANGVGWPNQQYPMPHM